MSRLCVGCFQGEQPLLSEEGIAPALLIGGASSEAGPLFLFAQDGAQPSSHEAVEDAIQGRRGVLEVAEPASQHRVEILNDPFEAVAPAADRPCRACP